MNGKGSARRPATVPEAEQQDRWAATFGPPKGGYAVVITDTLTGETRRVDVSWPWDDDSEYWWSDGNFGCDCNRAGLFHDDGGNGQCGYGRYRVRCESHDGAHLYRDVRD